MSGKAAMIAVLLAQTASIARQDDHSNEAEHVRWLNVAGSSAHSIQRYHSILLYLVGLYSQAAGAKIVATIRAVQIWVARSRRRSPRLLPQAVIAAIRMPALPRLPPHRGVLSFS